MLVKEYDSGVKLISNFVTPAECQDLIINSEHQGFEEAKINTGFAQEMFKDIRNNDRLFFDDFALAERLYHKLAPHVPDRIGNWQLLSLNERFRFYRYSTAQYFKWHRDGSYERSFDEVSKMTFMIYLNDDFDGGDTEFRDTSIQPESGAALIFPHRLMHQGSTVQKGVKYVLRTDVMYSRV